MSFSDNEDLLRDDIFKNEAANDQADKLSELSDDVLPRFLEMTGIHED